MGNGLVGTNADIQDVGMDQQMMDSVDDMAQKEIILINKILKYIVGNKVNQMITFMLTQYQEGLSKEVLDMIREEIKNVFE